MIFELAERRNHNDKSTLSKTQITLDYITLSEAIRSILLTTKSKPFYHNYSLIPQIKRYQNIFTNEVEDIFTNEFEDREK